MTCSSRGDFAVLGIGTAVPPYGVDQAEAAEFAAGLIGLENGSRRLLQTLYRRSGVQRRYSVVLEGGTDSDATLEGETVSPARPLAARQQLFSPSRGEWDEGPTTSQRMACYREKAGELATRAAKVALDDAEVAPEEVTHLVTVSCTGFAAPGVDFDLIERLGLPLTTMRTHVGFMGCHGAINGLRVAAAFAADPRATVLLCAVELCSLHQQYGWHPDRIVANSLFADGAAAMVGRQAASSGADDWSLSASGSCVLEQAKELMTWQVGDHGFVMELSPEVPQVISRRLRPWLEGWLAGQGYALSDIESWVIHPGGPRVVQTVAESLELPESAVVPSKEILEQFGNMSSPTVLFILQLLRQRRARRPALMLAFGPGLAIEVALWQ